jgi:hypothetical protein
VVLIIAILFMPNGILGLAQQAWRLVMRRTGKQPPVPVEKGGGDAPA